MAGKLRRHDLITSTRQEARPCPPANSRRQPVLFSCRTSVLDAGSALKQHRVNALLGQNILKQKETETMEIRAVHWR